MKRLLIVILIVIFIFLLLKDENMMDNSIGIEGETYEVIEKIISPYNKKDLVVIIKNGISGGATVSFAYQFFITKKNKKSLYKPNMFLWVKGMDEYKIKWVSQNEIELNVKGSAIIDFTSYSYVANDNNVVGSDFFYIKKFLFRKTTP